MLRWGGRGRCRAWPLLLGLAAAFCPGAAVAVPEAVMLQRADTALSLAAWAQVWIDSLGDAQVHDVLAQPEARWSRLDTQPVFRADSPAAVWLRFRLGRTSLGGAWYLDLTKTNLDHARLFRLDPGGTVVEAQTAGDRYPSSVWPVEDRRAVFLLQAQPDRPVDYLLRLEHRVDFGLVPQLWHEKDYLRHRQLVYLAIGGYFGLALVALIYIALQAYTRREAVFTWYAVYLLAMVVTQAWLTGVLRQFLLREALWLRDLARVHIPLALALISIAFVRELLPKPLAGRRFDALLLGVIAAGVVIGLAYWLVPIGAFWPVYNAFLCSVLILVAAMFVRARRFRTSTWGLYAAGVAAIAFGASLTLLVNMAVLPSHWVTENAIQIGSVVEVVLLTYGLSRWASEIDIANGRLRALQTQDPLTGLLLPRVMMDRLDALARRVQHPGRFGAVVLLEVANWKTLGEQHGIRAADRALVVAAQCVKACVGAGDTVARFGDDRIVALMETMDRPEQVVHTVEQMIECSLRYRESSGESEPIHLQAAVAYLPQDLSGKPAELIGRLAILLGREQPGRGPRIARIRELSVEQSMAQAAR